MAGPSEARGPGPKHRVTYCLESGEHVTMGLFCHPVNPVSGADDGSGIFAHLFRSAIALLLEVLQHEGHLFPRLGVTLSLHLHLVSSRAADIPDPYCASMPKRSRMTELGMGT